MIHAHWCIITLLGRRAPPKRLHCGKFAGYASEHFSQPTERTMIDLLAELVESWGRHWGEVGD
jgi:hypothetical protein